MLTLSLFFRLSKSFKILILRFLCNYLLFFQNKMEWSESAFGIFLGAFYWSYWITELPGGLLAQRFGGKRVLGSCVTVSAILNFLIPAASKYHYLLASFFRALQGITLVRQKSRKTLDCLFVYLPNQVRFLKTCSNDLHY